MAGEIQVTVTGNLTADPELRFTPGGDAVVNFTIASTPRIFKDGGWADGEPTFIRVAGWRKLGEHAADSFTKGSRVVVIGKLKQHNWETKDGDKRSNLVLEAEDIAGSVMFRPLGGPSSADVNRAGAEKAEAVWGGNGGTVDDDPPF